MEFLNHAGGLCVVVAVEDMDPGSASPGWRPSPARKTFNRGERIPYSSGQLPSVWRLKKADDRLGAMTRRTDSGRFSGVEARDRRDVAITRLVCSV